MSPRLRPASVRSPLQAPCTLAAAAALLWFAGCSQSGSADTEAGSSSSGAAGTTVVADASSSSSGTPLACEAEIMIPKGATIVADGELEPFEWAGGTTVLIPVQATEVPVTLAHDGERLNIAFQGLAEGGLILFPEVYVDPLNDKTAMFGSDDWWFHTDDEECGAQGMLDAWPTCTADNPDWDATTGSPSPIVEYSIPFELLGIDLSTTCEFGLSVRVTNTQTVAEIWPDTAAADEPDTWTTVALAL